MFWAHVALLAGGMLVSWLLKENEENKEEKPPKFTTPRTEPGPSAIYYGRVRIDSPFVLWRGNVRNRTAIDVATGQPIYWYEANVALQFGIPPATTLPVKLHRVYVDDRRPLQDNLASWPPSLGAGGESFTTPLEEGDTGYIVDDDFFGDPAQGAGLAGAITFHEGSFTQIADPEMATGWYVDALGTSQEVTDVDASANTLTIPSHGLMANVGPLHIAAVSGFYPGGLAGLTDYYVKTVVSADKITLSETAGGSTVDITSTGTAPIHVTLIDQTGHPNATKLPGFRGRTWAYLWAGFNAGALIRENHPSFIWGNRPTLPRFGGEVEAIPNGLGAGLGYIPLSTFGERIGANPIEIVRDILVNPWGRCGLPSSIIDTTSFEAAAATLQTEKFGLNFVSYQGRTARDLLGELMRCVGGALYEEPTTGKIHIKLIRADYTVGALPTYDESNSVVLNHAIGSWQSTVNSVSVRYLDRDSNNEVDSAPQQDLANIVSTGGRLRPTVNAYIGVTDAQLASNLAARDLHTLSQPLAKVRISANRSAATLRPGSAFKFTNAELGLTDVVFRVGSPNLGTLTDGRVVFDAIQDAFEEVAGSGLVAPPSPPAIPSTPPGCIPTSSTAIIELPRWLGWKLGLANPEASRIAYLAAQPTNASSYNAQTKWPSGNPLLANTFTTLRSAVPFAHRFVVETAYSRLLEPIDNAIGLRVTMSAAARATLASEADNAIRSQGRNLALLGPVDGQYEILAFGDVSLDGLVTVLESVRRGLIDTAPIAIPVGTPGWLLPATDDARHVALTKIFDGDETIVSRLLPRNANVSLSPARAPLIEQTLAARASRPLPPQRFLLNASNAPDAVTEENEADATWRRRERGKALINFGNDADDREPDTTYYIDARIDAEYAPRYRHPSSAIHDWAPLATAIDDDEAYTPFAELSHGTALVRVHAVQPDPTPSDPSLPPAEVQTPIMLDDRYSSFTAPIIEVEVPRYRQLLINGGFDDESSIRGWTQDVGTAESGTGVDGGVAVGTAGGGLTLSQSVKIAPYSPVGLYADLRFFTYLHASYTVEVSMGFYTSGGSLIDTATTTGSGSGTPEWIAHEFRTLIPATTASIKVTAICPGGGSTWRGVDAFDLRVGDITAELITNSHFNSNTTGWTVSGGTWASSSIANMTGGAGLRCTAGTGELYQDLTLTQDGYNRGTAHLQGWRKSDGTGSADEMQFTLEARNAAETVLATTSGSLTVANDGQWHIENLYLDLTDDAIDHLRVRIKSVTNPVTANEFSVDNVRCVVHRDLHPTSEYLDVDFQTPATQAFPTVPTCPANTETHVWQCQDEQGDLAIVDAMGVQGADFVADSALLMERIAVGINDSVLGYNGRKAIESHAGLAVGTGASVTSTTVMDAGNATTGSSLALDIVFRSAELPAASRGIVTKRIASAGAGWGLYLTSTGGLTLTVEIVAGTEASCSTAGVNFCDGAWHRVRVLINRDAGTFGLRTDRHTPTPVAIPGDGDLTAASSYLALLGHTNTDRAESIQIASMTAWRGAHAEARDDADDFAAAWTHASDPTGLGAAITYDLADAVAMQVAQGSNGIIVGAYAPGQVPHWLSDSRLWLATSAVATNLVDPDPASADWTAGEVPAGPSTPSENGFYLPTTIAESTEIGGTLDHLWLMQASGSPIPDDTTGTPYDLTAAGVDSANITYEQARGGWTRYFVRVPSNDTAYLLIGNPFDSTTTSAVAMLLMEVGDVSGGTRNFITFGTAGGSQLLASLLAAGNMRLNIAGNTYDGSYVYESDGDVHMVSLEWDTRSGVEDARIVTDEETIEGAHATLGANLTTKRFASNGLAPELWIGWAGLAIGTNAEALIDAAGGSVGVYTV